VWLAGGGGGVISSLLGKIRERMVVEYTRPYCKVLLSKVSDKFLQEPTTKYGYGDPLRGDDDEDNATR